VPVTIWCRTIGAQANLIRCGTLPRWSAPARFPNTQWSFLNVLNLPKYRWATHRFGFPQWVRLAHRQVSFHV
jgi:hypothetical protein